jgi:hypothetical protein
MEANMPRVSPLDKPANTTGLTQHPDLKGISSEEMGPFEYLVLWLATDDLVVADEAAVLAWSKRQVREACQWLAYRQAQASDHVVRKKRLEWPAHCVGTLRNPTPEERRAAIEESQRMWSESQKMRSRGGMK